MIGETYVRPVRPTITRVIRPVIRHYYVNEPPSTYAAEADASAAQLLGHNPAEAPSGRRTWLESRQTLEHVGGCQNYGPLFGP